VLTREQLKNILGAKAAGSGTFCSDPGQICDDNLPDLKCCNGLACDEDVCPPDCDPSTIC
jgi:hypothetical protein